MACVTIDAVVHISVHVRVIKVGGIATAVAGGCATEYRVIGGVSMAGRADRVCIAMVGGEEGVVTARQGSGHPRRSGVAGDAGCGPSRGSVVGIRGPREICLMAGVAVGRSPSEDIIDVAKGAGHGGVRAGQRERCAVVIEGGPGPGRCGVAGIASGGEACCCMRGIRGSVIVCLVATVASGGKRSVVTGGASVALHALHGCVEPCQRECRGGVIEC